MEIKTRRLGRFRVTRNLIDDVIAGKCSALAGWHAIFSKCVVVDLQHHYVSAAIDYTVYCEELDEVPECCAAPEYTVTISRHEEFLGAQKVETYNAKFERVKG